MAKRPKVLPKIEAEVLRKSRGRCCICFGLNGDDTVKKGQIADVNGDQGNTRPPVPSNETLSRQESFEAGMTPAGRPSTSAHRLRRA